MKFLKASLLVIFLVLATSLAFAQDSTSATPAVVATHAVTATVALPTVSADGNLADVVKIGTDLVKNYKTLGIWGILSCVVVILLSLLNNGLIAGIKGFSLEWKHLSNVVLSTILGISSALYFGGNWISVLISVLVISGGATMIYKALLQVGLLKKKVATKAV